MPEIKSKGIRIGLRDLHYARLTSDDETGTVYGTPEKIVGAITAKISPKTDMQKHYSDDGLTEVASSQGETEVEFGADDLPLQVQADLLGHTLGTDGVLLKNRDDAAPYVALGFRSLKSNGNFRYVWLYKGKFEAPEEEYQTKGENVEFKTPTIKGIFLPRESDGNWQATGDEDDATFAAGDTWFDAVYEKPVIP